MAFLIIFKNIDGKRQKTLRSSAVQKVRSVLLYPFNRLGTEKLKMNSLDEGDLLDSDLEWRTSNSKVPSTF